MESPDAGDPLILLHGAGCNALWWEPLAHALGNRHVIALDLPGHGESARVDDWDVVRLADVLGEAVASLVEGPVLWGGHSWGGKLAASDGREHVLRVYPSPEREAGLCTEKAALGAAAAAGSPVARVEATGTLDSLPMLVLSWLEGEPLLSHLQRRPWRVRSLGRELGRMQARLHEIPPPDQLRAGAPANWLAWTGVSGVIEQMERLGPSIGTGSLIHLDFHPLNVLTDGRRITGILDWGSSAAGDPRADIARTAALLRAGPLPPGPLKPFLSLFRNAFYNAWRRAYEDAASVTVEASPFMAWGAATWIADIERNEGNAEGWADQEGVVAAHRWLGRWTVKETP